VCKTIESTRRHVIKLPTLSQEEMRILRQKPASQTDVFMQGLALSLLDEEDGFYKALEVLLGSCKDISHELAKEMLRKRIRMLRRGNVQAWCTVDRITDRRPDSPVCRIMQRFSPLRRKSNA